MRKYRDEKHNGHVGEQNHKSILAASLTTSRHAGRQRGAPGARGHVLHPRATLCELPPTQEPCGAPADFSHASPPLLSLLCGSVAPLFPQDTRRFSSTSLLELLISEGLFFILLFRFWFVLLYAKLLFSSSCSPVLRARLAHCIRAACNAIGKLTALLFRGDVDNE